MSSAEIPPEPAIAARALSAGYSDIPVIRAVTIAVQPGQLVAVVGPNGAGKSTLVKAMLGIAKVMAGQVLAGGRDITGRPLDELARAGIGYVPQVDDVFDTLRVHENLRMGGYLLTKAARARRMDEVLDIFPPLRSRLHRYVGTLSGGERKMVAIGRALMLSPQVLLLDEPTAGLSPALTDAVLGEQVRTLADHGHAVLLVEQRAQAALKLADYACVLVQGQVAMAAPAASVLASPEMAEIFLGGGRGGDPRDPARDQAGQPAGPAADVAGQTRQRSGSTAGRAQEVEQ